MKLVKFFAAAIAAVAMFAACESPKENQGNEGGDVIVQEFVNVYCDITATDWEKCGVWAWNLDNTTENYTGGVWPGQELTEKETIDGVEYYVWKECPKQLVGTEIGFIVNEFVDGGAQTADIKLPVADGIKVSVTPNDEGGYIILINGEEFTPEEPEEKFVDELLEGEHTFGICGNMTNWGSPLTEGEEPVADIAMTLENGWYTATIECAVDAQFKVRADGKWDYSFGYNVTDEAPLAPVNGEEFIASFNGQDNNIVVAEAGSYKVEFQIAEVEEEYVGKMKITKLAAEAE